MTRAKMISYIRQQAVKKLHGKTHRFYEFVNFSEYTDAQVRKIYKELPARS